MLIQKIQHSLKQIPPFKKVIVGVSGGSDSVTLAHLLIQLGYDVTIAHLNHGLRGEESDADERFVDNLSKKWKVLFVSHKIQLTEKCNTENNARILRYAFFEKVRYDKKAKFIAVAHHKDDQVETVLMHMMRGAGLRGLCGMRNQTNHIIRPLLDVSKQDLVDYLKEEGVKYRTDKSNFDIRFKRNLLRHKVIPKLQKKDKDYGEKLLRMSEMAREQFRIIEKQAVQWVKKEVVDNNFGRLAFLNLSENVKSEVLFQLCGTQNIYRPSIQKIKELIQKGATGKQKQIGQHTFQIQYDRVVLYKGFKNDKIPKKVQLKVKEIRWGDWKLKHNGSNTLFVRSWQPGDRFQPAGMKGSKKLQDYFVDKKIPKSERHQIPIIVDEENRILSVGNLRFSGKAVEMDLKRKLTIQQ